MTAGPKNSSAATQFGPPKLDIGPAIKGWAAVVLAVTSKSKVSHIDLLRHTGRSSEALAEARRLTIWVFMEVVDADDEDYAVGWLEQCLGLSRRSITDALKGEPPALLRACVETYARLRRQMGPSDVLEAIAAGLLGQRRHRARVWPKGFLERLGIEY